jgi:hypothetical protein
MAIMNFWDTKGYKLRDKLNIKKKLLMDMYPTNPQKPGGTKGFGCWFVAAVEGE